MSFIEKRIARLSASIAAVEAAEQSARAIGWEAMAEANAAQIVSLQTQLDRANAKLQQWLQSGSSSVYG
jgi:hypothetical protein